jgi:non-specific serine/threonine protein kinase/serine/threonine-protein kinase
MTPERWERLKALFAEGAGRPGPQRRAFVESLTGDDADLRVTLLSLLEADQDDAFLAAPAPGLGGGDGAAMPERLGAYAVVREIGRGGMGAVYLAARADDEFEKRVAIKLVPAGLGGRVLRERFRQERQILARLDHPGIARLLDGGTTADGTPWVAMEYVDGLPITEYCDRHLLGLDARLRLFRLVCSAVHYAHQNLVVHQDLKPGNVLVAGDGTPKLLDFGIAGLLGTENGAGTRAVAGLQALTPDYASPEQLRGEPVTILTDVYSLGVVLFELIAGKRPYRMTGATPAEIERIHESGLVPPSSVRSVRSVPRDLDAIDLKAMSLDPAGRYGSVELLSEDVERFLAGDAVEARQGNAAYRLRRFARRHKALVAAAALVILSLLGGIVASARQARIAERERARAESRLVDLHKMSKALLFDIYKTIEHLPGSLPAREAVVKKALEYLGALAAESAGNSGLSRDLASAYQRVGEIQGHPFFANLGDTAGCLASLRIALAMREKLLLGDPGNVDLERDRNASLGSIGSVQYRTGDVALGLATLRRAHESRSRLAARHPDDRRLQRDLAVSFIAITDALSTSGDRAAALASANSARVIMEPLARTRPDDRGAFRDLLIAQGKAASLMGESGDLQGAAAALEASAVDLRRWLGRQPHDAELRRDLEITLNKIGDGRLEAHQPGPAVAAHREALEIAESLLAADRKDARGQGDLFYTRTRLGMALAAAGDSKGAEASFRTATDDAEALLAASPNDPFARSELAAALSEWGNLLVSRGDRTGGRTKLERALAISEALVAEDGKNAEYSELREKTRSRIAAAGRPGAAGL